MLQSGIATKAFGNNKLLHFDRKFPTGLATSGITGSSIRGLYAEVLFFISFINLL